jgi:hypothetical protein
VLMVIFAFCILNTGCSRSTEQNEPPRVTQNADNPPDASTNPPQSTPEQPGVFKTLPVHPKAKLISSNEFPERYIVEGESVETLIAWYGNHLAELNFRAIAYVENPYKAPVVRSFIKDNRTMVILSLFPESGGVRLIVSMNGAQ